MQDPLRILRSGAYPLRALTETRSDAVGLQPEFEHAELPDLAGTRWRAVVVGRLEHAVDQAGREELALAGGRRGQRLPYEIEVRALELDQRGDREVALGPVDHRVGHEPARRVLEDALAALRDLQLRRAGGRELDDLVV